MYWILESSKYYVKSVFIRLIESRTFTELKLVAVLLSIWKIFLQEWIIFAYFFPLSSAYYLQVIYILQDRT